MKRLLSALITVGLGAVSMATAHDGVNHKGKGTQGQVVAISGDRFDLKTAKETLHVTMSSKTKFEHDNKGVDRTHLTKGAHVTVIGTKLPSGEMVAKEVVIGQMDAHAGDHSKVPHAPHAPETPHHK